MKVGYLPENMEAYEAMKYSFKDNYANGGFSFILWRLGKDSDFQTCMQTTTKKRRSMVGK